MIPNKQQLHSDSGDFESRDVASQFTGEERKTNMSFILINLLLILFFLLLTKPVTSTDVGLGGFTFTGFSTANLSLDGLATLTSDGLLQLTNYTTHKKAHAFHPSPLPFKPPLSFSTTYVFAIRPQESYVGGHGIAFCLSPTTNFSSAIASQYLGLFSPSDNGNSTNHIFAVELDTIMDPDLDDINDNHLGLDLNSLVSVSPMTAGYYDDLTGSFHNLTLISGDPMQVWIDFDSEQMQVNVTLALVPSPKPRRPLISSKVNLARLVLDEMFVGFSSSTGSFLTSHYLLGWSFKLNGTGAELDHAKLPSLPPIVKPPSSSGSNALAVWLPIALSLFVLLAVCAAVLLVKRRRKYAEILEDWEREYGPHRFRYRDLYRATKGFREKELLGKGGFGRVYKGVLSGSKMEVAVKKVSHESRQGMKEFVAEIVSIGQLRHRNLVQLLGYCRRKGELLLVYDYMPNGSLDRFLYDGVEPTLSWAQRFQVTKGVASCLLYMHEDWEQVVIHRDIKASNVLLDSEMNGRLGDFGLARLYDHGTDPQTTHVVGTMGYLAPELTRKGKASPKTDVFAFGAFLLEVACGRRPIEPEAELERVILMDWVLMEWQRGTVIETRDMRLGEEFWSYEVELVLKLGLLCLNPMPEARPSMRQIVQFLEGDLVLPELPASYMSISSLSLYQNEGFDDYLRTFSSSMASFSGVSRSP